MPSSDFMASVWFRRLKDLKEKYNPKVQLILTCHSSSAEDFFAANPYIDEIKPMGWPAKYFNREHYPVQWIHKAYDWKEFNPSPVEFYLTEDDKKLLTEIRLGSKYVVIHPFARKSRRELPFEYYYPLVESLSQKGYKSVVIGSSYTLITDTGTEEIKEEFNYQHRDLVNLTGKVNVRIIPHLILNASGFIGTHSCWILLAWWKKKPTLCFVPDVKLWVSGKGYIHWREWKKIDLCAWGFAKPYNKMVWIKEEHMDLNYGELANFLAT